MKDFPPFRLDTVNQCLWRHRYEGDDERILLTPKAFGVLNYLIEHAGQLVTHDELLDAVWKDTFIQPQAVKKIILDLRSALGDQAKNPLFIETLHRRGYRFIAAVSEGTGMLPRFSGSPTIPIGNAHLRKALWMVVLNAVRCNPWLRQYYERLRAAGKPGKVAVIAAMRKLLAAVWSVATHRRPFVPHLPPIYEERAQ